MPAEALSELARSVLESSLVVWLCWLLIKLSNHPRSRALSWSTSTSTLMNCCHNKRIFKRSPVLIVQQKPVASKQTNDTLQ